MSALTEILNNRYDNVISTSDYIIAEGDIPVALVAHLDTVFNLKPIEFFYDAAKRVMWCPSGAGFDDRAGVAIILQILRDGYRPHIIFTAEEEIGGIGASKLADNYKNCPFKKCNMLIELDRQGHNEAVYYKCDNERFEKYITNFGFDTDIGSFSDISVIAPQWGIAAVNLSVGYVDEHSPVERLYLNWLENTIEKVENILKDNRQKSRFFKYIPSKLNFKSYFSKNEDFFSWLEGEDK